MLTRIRIEVEGEDSAAACEEALTKYEHVLQEIEMTRWALHKDSDSFSASHPWPKSVVSRSFYNGELGREVTDEVIEYDPSQPGYKGRRVVQFKRALQDRCPAPA